MHFRAFAELKIDMLNSDRASVVVAETTFEISWRWIVRGFLFSSLRLLSAKNEEYPEKSQKDRAIAEVAARLPSYLSRSTRPLDNSLHEETARKPRFSEIWTLKSLRKRWEKD
jgi:hypothetical protein